MTRKYTVAALGLVATTVAACEPTIQHVDKTPVVTAVFDPTTAQIPLPNDLAFLNDPNTTCPPPGNALPAGSPPACAQAELLASFGGKFPSDQEIAVTISFTETTYAADGTPTQIAPDLDLTSFTPSTFFVWGQTAGGTGEIPVDPLTAADYVKGTTSGTLSIHHQGHQPWAPGQYAVLVRGGTNGIKTTDGTPVNPSQTFYLIAQDKDLASPLNNGLLKAQLGSSAAAAAAGQQLNMLIRLYDVFAFPAADMRFPRQELAITTTFQIQPTVTNVEIDPARSLVPLPIDLLRDPTSGKLSTLAACTFAGSKLAADGTCPSAAAAGFESLDGFSTTGAILAPTSDLVDANTVTGSTVLMFDLSTPSAPVQVDPTSLILEPCEFTSSCSAGPRLSPVVAIQPAGATSGDATSVFRSKPLKDNTDYAVVITTGVHDKAGVSLGKGTVAKILHFKNPIVVGGHSALSGIDDTTAASLEKMRLQLAPVFDKLAATGTADAAVAIAYTFKTQTILSQAVQLAALPYIQPAATALPGAVNAITPVAAFTKYGVDQTRVPFSHIDEVLEPDITTFNALNPATGAFLADPTQAAAETIHALVVTPKASAVPPCTGVLAQAGFTLCAPVMVFRHGLGGGRADMLTVADSNAAQGMITIAIDAPLHGDRAFCTPGAPGQCKGGGACTTNLPAGAQGDANPPGTCGAAGYTTAPVSPTCTGACATNATNGIPLVSANYFVTANFFRTRDAMRQDLIDESQLIRAIVYTPTGAPPPFGHTVADHLIAKGILADPLTIYYSGQSLGSIQGAANVASNPRISKAVFNVGGGTIVDIFTNSPAFKGNVDALLASLGIQPGTSAFLQFLVVAKTVLDPADPINYVGHLTANTLPNLLTPLGGNPDGSVPQTPKKILTQNAYCDAVVPNPFNFIYASNIPTGPLPTGASFFAPGATGTFQLIVNTGFNPATFPTCANGGVEHGFITDWLQPSLTQAAQNDLAAFVAHDTIPTSIQHP